MHVLTTFSAIKGAMCHECVFTNIVGGHGRAVVTHLPPTSEVSGSNPRPYLGKWVVAYRLSAVYNTEP